MNSSNRWAPVFCGLVVIMASGRMASAQSGPQCIPASARQSLDACPEGAAASLTKQPTSRAPTTHLNPAERTKRATAQRTVGPEYVRPDPRLETLQVRERDLLEREIQVAQRIVERQRAGDVRGADVVLRLAELYFETQTWWRNRSGNMDQQIYEAEQAGNRARTEELRRQQTEANTQVGRYRDQALATYARLIRDYPSYPRMDEVLFSLAFGLGEAQQVGRAREVYARLIKNFPQSRFVPHAWLSFAEFYFGEADMPAARRMYEQVIQTPPARNPVYGYALYKLAWVLYNMDDFAGSLVQFARVIEYARDNPTNREAPNLARQARSEVVMPYARSGRPNEALRTFRRMAQNDDEAFEMLESLGELYFDTGQWNDAIAIYHQLMSERSTSDKLCYWQSRVSSAIISTRAKPEQLTEVRRLVDIQRQFVRATHPAESIAQCRQSTATVLIELSTAWHREAVGSDEQPGTNDRNTMQLASNLYDLLLQEFPDLENMEFPEINREDWPTQYSVAYFQAELLWKMEDWGRCGPAFDRVVEMNPQGEFTADAAYAAVLCYNNLYSQQYQSREREVRSEGAAPAAGGRRRGRRARQEAAPEQTEAERLAVRPLEPTQQGMLNAFNRFICFVRDSDELPVVKYRRARIYYETNRFEEAALAFRDIVDNHGQHELAEYAANLYLDSLETIRRRDSRASCLDDIESSLPVFERTFQCTGAGAEAHADICETVQRLKGQIKRLRCETFAAAQQHPEAARCYVEAYRIDPQADDADQVLWNAAIHYEAARFIMRAVRVRRVLLERFPESNLAKRALYLIGANYHALAIYGEAADYYEQFARRFPGEFGEDCTEADRTANTCAVAPQALENAIFFRLGLGEEERAIADIELYERSYRRRMPRETANVRFSLGSLYERQGAWQRVYDHYSSFLRNYGRQAPIQQVIRANVQVGRSVWEVQERQRDRAQPFFQTAVRTWERGGLEALNRAMPEGERERAAFQAREAVSEALFYLGEYQFNAFREVRFPRFSGSRNLASVNRWSSEELGPWLQRKIAALQAATAAYGRIEPLNIPQWHIAAAARIGEMYRTIIDDVRSAPIPEEIEADDELYGIYTTALESVLNGSTPGPDGRWDTADDQNCDDTSTAPNCVGAPVRQAREKFSYCLTLSTQVRWFNEYSSQCELELNRMDPGLYPLAAELRGTASYVEDRAAPVRAAQLRSSEEEEEEGGTAPAAAGGGRGR